MNEFLQALIDPSMPFLRLALLTALLASIAFGIMGTYVVSRRISYLAGAIAHSAMGGIGCAVYLQKVHGLVWVTPMFGAIVSALLSALIIGWVTLKAGEREDTVTGAIWAIGMATGLLFMAKTPGYVDAMGYLFGNILLTGTSDIITALCLDIFVIILVALFYSRFQAVCFDEEFARVRGIKTNLYYILLLCLTALTVVLLIRVAGIVLVIALLTLPSAIAGRMTRSLWQMMIVSAVLCAVFCTVGLALGYIADLPAGPCIIVTAGLTYLATFRK